MSTLARGLWRRTWGLVVKAGNELSADEGFGLVRSKGMLDEVSFGRLEKIPSSSWTRHEKNLGKKNFHPKVGCGTNRNPGRELKYEK